MGEEVPWTHPCTVMGRAGPGRAGRGLLLLVGLSGGKRLTELIENSNKKEISSKKKVIKKKKRTQYTIPSLAPTTRTSIKRCTN